MVNENRLLAVVVKIRILLHANFHLQSAHKYLLQMHLLYCCFSGVGRAAAPRARVSRFTAVVLLRGRKVRTPKGRAPGNAWGAQAYGKCHRKYTARTLGCG